MKKHLLFSAVILMILLMSDAHADEVIMKNGDRLHGEVVYMEAGKLIFKTPYASKNVIPWDQVERLTSEKILEISLPDEVPTKRFRGFGSVVGWAAGAGYQFWESERKNLTLKIGPSYMNEHYSKPMASMDNKDYRKYAAGFWAIDFDMWFFDRFLQVFHHDDAYLSFEDTNVWRLRARTGIRIPITHGFFTSLQYDYDWVNAPADRKLHYGSKVVFKLGWAL